MDNTNEMSYQEPKYTKLWLGLQILYAFMGAGFLALIAMGISSFAGYRLEMGLLRESHYELISSSANYCFVIIAITLLSLTLMELAYRKGANLIQYALIGCALCLFYLLLLSMAEHFKFWAAYLIVSAMTIGLIAWFIKGITGKTKAAYTISGILAAEYGILLILIYLGSTVLLVGSILLFALIAIAMYLTLRLKTENEEFILK